MDKKNINQKPIKYKSIGCSRVEKIYLNSTNNGIRIGIITEKASIDVEKINKDTKVIVEGRYTLNVISTNSAMTGISGNCIGIVTELLFESKKQIEIQNINNYFNKIESKIHSTGYIKGNTLATIRLLNPVKKLHKKRRFVV